MFFIFVLQLLELLLLESIGNGGLCISGCGVGSGAAFLLSHDLVELIDVVYVPLDEVSLVGPLSKWLVFRSLEFLLLKQTLVSTLLDLFKSRVDILTLRFLLTNTHRLVVLGFQE